MNIDTIKTEKAIATINASYTVIERHLLSTGNSKRIPYANMASRYTGLLQEMQ